MSSYYVNKVLFKIKHDHSYRRLFLENFERSLDGFDLTGEEIEALRRRDYGKLFALGAKSMLLLPFAGIAKPGDMFTVRGKFEVAQKPL